MRLAIEVWKTTPGKCFCLISGGQEVEQGEDFGALEELAQLGQHPFAAAKVRAPIVHDRDAHLPNGLDAPRLVPSDSEAISNSCAAFPTKPPFHALRHRSLCNCKEAGGSNSVGSILECVQFSKIDQRSGG